MVSHVWWFFVAERNESLPWNGTHMWMNNNIIYIYIQNLLLQFIRYIVLMMLHSEYAYVHKWSVYVHCAYTRSKQNYYYIQRRRIWVANLLYVWFSDISTSVLIENVYIENGDRCSSKITVAIPTPNWLFIFECICWAINCQFSSLTELNM